MMKLYQKTRWILAFTIILSFENSIKAQDSIIPKQILTAVLGSKTITKVDVRETDFKGGQRTPYHRHSCPVLGYIITGEAFFQMKGSGVKILKTRDVFYEPENMPIVHFDNASMVNPLKFIAYYLINDEKELIELLPIKK